MVSTDRVIAQREWRAKIGDRRELRAVAKLYSLGGQRPYFSLTGEERNLRRRGDNQVEVCGQMSEQLVAQWPELAPLAAIHLSDEHGVPMHAAEDGAYWLGFTSPCADGAPDFARFARLWRCSEERAREVYDYAKADPNPREAVRFCTRDEMYRWQREADAALELLRSGWPRR